MTVTVGLLRMDDLPESGRHVRGDYPELYASLFAGTDTELLDVEVHRGDAPASLDDADVWVLTGSRYSVYDDLPWIPGALELTRELVARELPAVGICFGHQLFAQALGGRVEKVGWRIGVRDHRTLTPLPWFPEARHELTLIASHQDQVLDAPPGTTVWSTAESCPIAGLLIGDRAWSVQGHPEFTTDVVDALYEGRRERLGDERLADARSTYGRPLDNAALARAVVRFAGR